MYFCWPTQNKTKLLLHAIRYISFPRPIVWRTCYSSSICRIALTSSPVVAIKNSGHQYLEYSSKPKILPHFFHPIITNIPCSRGRIQKWNISTSWRKIYLSDEFGQSFFPHLFCSWLYFLINTRMVLRSKYPFCNTATAKPSKPLQTGRRAKPHPHQCI